jgi:hypothetical protein
MHNVKQLKVGDLLVVRTGGITLPPIAITRIECSEDDSNVYYFDNEGWGIFGYMLQERLEKGSMQLYSGAARNA